LCAQVTCGKLPVSQHILFRQLQILGVSIFVQRNLRSIFIKNRIFLKLLSEHQHHK
jgi:hypothetical protein